MRRSGCILASSGMDDPQQIAAEPTLLPSVGAGQLQESFLDITDNVGPCPALGASHFPIGNGQLRLLHYVGGLKPPRGEVCFVAGPSVCTDR